MSVHACTLSHVQLFATSWTVAHQSLLSMGFSRQEYWSGLPFPSPGDLPNPGTESDSLAFAGGFFTTEPPGNIHLICLDNCLSTQLSLCVLVTVCSYLYVTHSPLQ